MDAGQAVNELQALYDSEINFVISTLWDGGFDWKLGDDLNGFKESGCGDTVLEAIEDLMAAARKHYPNSQYAQRD